MHLLEDERATYERLLGVLARAVDLGARDGAGEHRRLRDGEVLCALAEGAPRGFFDAIASVAEVDVIQIELEDLVFAELLLEAPREERFANLAPKGSLWIQHEVLHHLLCDRRASLTEAPAPQVDEHRAGDAEVVEAVVLVEACVLGAEHRELHVGGQRLDGHHRAPLDEDLGEKRPVAGEHARHLGGVVVALQVGNRREALLVVPDHPPQDDETHDDEHCEHHGRAFAPLPRELARAPREREEALLPRRGHAGINAGGWGIRPGHVRIVLDAERVA